MGFLEQMCEIRLFSVSVWVHVKLSQSVSQSVSQITLLVALTNVDRESYSTTALCPHYGPIYLFRLSYIPHLT